MNTTTGTHPAITAVGQADLSRHNRAGTDTLVALRHLAATAVANSDIDLLRSLLTRGATFASFTIRCQTPAAEQAYSAWQAAGEPADLTQAPGLNRYLIGARQATQDSLRALTDSQVLTIMTAPPVVAEQVLMDSTVGLLITKASFSLACSGVGQVACLDSRLRAEHYKELSTLGLKENGSWPAVDNRKRAQKDGWQAYLAGCQTLWPGTTDTALAQWQEWLEGLATDARRPFNTTHGVLLAGQVAS